MWLFILNNEVEIISGACVSIWSQGDQLSVSESYGIGLFSQRAESEKWEDFMGKTE